MAKLAHSSRRRNHCFRCGLLLTAAIAPLEVFPHAMSSRFLFAVVQAGAERALKNEIARDQPKLKFAFSRPGFVTFRIPDDVEAGREPKLDCVFARTWGYSLGKVASGADDAQLARDAWRLIEDQLPSGAARS